MNALNEKIEENRTAPDLPAPTETHEWRYNPRDLLDESIFGIIILAVFVILGIVMQGTAGWWIWLTLIFPAGYFLWLAYTLFVRRMCTVYRLTPQNFIYQRGFLVQSTMYVELFDIDQVNLKRNLWERVIGVGTIKLSIKRSALHDQSLVENSEQAQLVGGGGNKDAYIEITIPGMTDYENVRDLIDSYRLYVRQKRGIRISS